MYRKVDTKVWSDEKFRTLSDSGKLVFLMLLTHPTTQPLGAIRGTIGGFAEELGWEPKRFQKAFRETETLGMAKYDARSCMFYLPNFIKYNRPESPNVVKAWAKAYESLPECALRSEMLMAAEAFTEGFGEAFKKAFHKAFQKALPKGIPYDLPKGMPNQEQEQEQEKNLYQEGGDVGMGRERRAKVDLLGRVSA